MVWRISSTFVAGGYYYTRYQSLGSGFIGSRSLE